MSLPSFLNVTVPITMLLPSTDSVKSSFEDTPSINMTYLIIIIIVIFLYAFMSLVATYKLTGSWFQTFLCFLFGFLYMTLAYIYYGLAGYKLCK